LEQTAHILAQCAKALSRAEAAGIVHRDLKPGNVFLARQDEGMSMVVKILDFGVAKMPRSAEPSEATRVGIMLGSPQYMSPEQARSIEVDHRSDLWSMAAIVYRMITGKLAFNGQTEVDVIVNVCTGPVPVPSKILPAITPEIDAFFERAFQRDLDARFQSAIDLSQAFADAVRAAGEVTLLTPLPHDPLGQSHTTEPRVTPESPDASVPVSAAPTAASWANASEDELALEPRRPNRWPLALGAAAVLVAVGAVYALGGTASSEPSSIAPAEKGAADLAAAPHAAQEPADSAQVAPSVDASATTQAPPTAPPRSAQPQTPQPRTPRPAPAAPRTAPPDRPNWGY
jgi:serine/threonine-protein kinase